DQVADLFKQHTDRVTASAYGIGGFLARAEHSLTGQEDQFVQVLDAGELVARLEQCVVILLLERSGATFIGVHVHVLLGIGGTVVRGCWRSRRAFLLLEGTSDHAALLSAVERTGLESLSSAQASRSST